MAPDIERVIAEATGATRCWKIAEVQSLWSGYGSILRYGLEGSAHSQVIVKSISPPVATQHPRGWNTSRSHERKLRSYQVESVWYRDHAGSCGSDCRVPACLAVEEHGEDVLLILEDLDAAGFPDRRGSVTEQELHACLGWLAHFHATFLGNPGDGLWESGTYWHLETRPDELQALKAEDRELWAAADAIDRELKNATFQSLVHGDAKLANFCFSSNGKSVAAVDFQYVGRGCGMKDVAYFIGSCFGDSECEVRVPALLDHYFGRLHAAVAESRPELDIEALETEWRRLHPFAWTDFHRFLKGWSPGHWKIHSYSERLAEEVLSELQQP